MSAPTEQTRTTKRLVISLLRCNYLIRGNTNTKGLHTSESELGNDPLQVLWVVLAMNRELFKAHSCSKVTVNRPSVIPDDFRKLVLKDR